MSKDIASFLHTFPCILKEVKNNSLFPVHFLTKKQSALINSLFALTQYRIKAKVLAFILSEEYNNAYDSALTGGETKEITAAAAGFRPSFLL